MKNERVEYSGRVHVILQRKLDPPDGINFSQQIHYEIILADGRRVLTIVGVLSNLNPIKAGNSILAVGEEISENRLLVSDESDLLVQI
jgi:hypothetical protein